MTAPARKNTRAYDHTMKIVLMGDSGVGKSQLVQRFSKNTFNDRSEPTMALDYTTKVVHVKDKVICVHLWDLSGKPMFRHLYNSYYHGAAGAMIVYDITKVLSFENAKRWLENLHGVTAQTDNGPVTMVAGNKLDMRHLRSVTPNDGLCFAKENKSSFIETSAKDSANVRKAFHRLVEHAYDKIVQDQLRRDVMSGKGLEIGSKSLEETKRMNKPCHVTVVQQQPKKVSAIRKVAENCVKESKEKCSKCCFC